MHQLSKDRVKHWENTIAGQRRARILQRETRIKDAQEVHKKRDDEFAIDQTDRRRMKIEEAKLMMYCEEEPVKIFHSAIILDQVLQVRHTSCDSSIGTRCSNKIQNHSRIHSAKHFAKVFGGADGELAHPR